MCRFRPNVYGVNEILKRKGWPWLVSLHPYNLFSRNQFDSSLERNNDDNENRYVRYGTSPCTLTLCVCVSLFSLQHLAHLQEIAWWEILHQTAGSQGLVNPGVIADLWTLVPPQAWRACHSYTHTNYYATHPYITRLNLMCKVTMCLRIMTYVSFPCVT